MKFFRFSSLILLFAAALFIVSCSKDEGLVVNGSEEIEFRNRTGSTPPSAGPTIVEIALSDPNFSILVDAVVRAGLVNALSAPGPFTVFAPTNDAFTAFLSANGFNSVNDVPVNVLTTVLTTHVLSGEFFAADLSSGYFKTLADSPFNQKTDIFINTAGGVTINGSVNVTAADIDASNGVIHVINQVIAPSTIVTLAASNPNFSTLVTALTRPGLSTDFVAALSGAGPFTVMAPTNAAFQALLNSNPAWNSLNDIPTATLEAVLSYHVSATANYSSNFVLRRPVVQTLLPGATFTFDINFSGGSLGIEVIAGSNTANVVAADVQGQNGVIHAIDAVILP
jgi:uncharacterized surface protein with fasciclin (FAS1) repeats